MPIVIAIAAVSGGGKTMYTKLIQEKLENSKALHFDDYDFEAPEDLYDWVKRGANHNEWKLDPLINALKEILTNEAFEYILLDYPFAYLNKEMNEFIDLAVFIDTPLDIAMARRILRDYKDSEGEDIRKDLSNYLEGAREAYMNMLKTVKPSSDCIIDGTLNKEAVVQEIINLIKKL